MLDLVQEGGVRGGPSHSLTKPLKLAAAGNLQVDLVPARGLEGPRTKHLKQYLEPCTKFRIFLQKGDDLKQAGFVLPS